MNISMNMFAMFWFVVSIALAESPHDPVEEVDSVEFARSLSLKLRGVVPSRNEIEQIEATGGVDTDLILQWMGSEQFEEQVVWHHKSLFWNASFSNNLELKRTLLTSDGVYYRKFVAQFHRGLSRQSCTDWENTDVNEWNIPQTVLTSSVMQGGQLVSFQDEGWVWVTPYWNTITEIKVCTFDAQTNLFNDEGVDCSTEASNKVEGCGCGPNLQWCMNRSTEAIYKESMAEELSERVRRMVNEERPYTDLLTDNVMYYNGPLSFYYQHLDPFIQKTQAPTETFPDIDFSERDTWVGVETSDLHSGALTAPGWLLRHQTNRGRANRFYEAFLCSTFVPPVGGIIDEGVSTPDLSLKRGCADCHARLEPWRGYWGRWAEVSSAYVSPDEFPSFSQECADCAEGGSCNYTCRTNYMVDPAHADDSPYIGWYLPYVYLKLDQQYHPDDGPKAWVQNVSSDGTLAQCVAQNTASWLYGWSPDEVDPELLAEWASTFENSDFDYEQLILDMVMHPAYGRIQ